MRLKRQPEQTATFSRKTDALLWAQQIEADIRAGRRFAHLSDQHTSGVVSRMVKRLLR